MHLLKLSEAVKEGVEGAGMVGFRFNTIGVSDAISMGTRGMCFSLQSRDLIADSIETVMSAQWYDANISIPGCDKNVSYSFSKSSLLLCCYCYAIGLLLLCLDAWNNYGHGKAEQTWDYGLWWNHQGTIFIKSPY